jgi:hypothetical protein
VGVTSKFQKEPEHVCKLKIHCFQTGDNQVAILKDVEGAIEIKLGYKLPICHLSEVEEANVVEVLEDLPPDQPL